MWILIAMSIFAYGDLTTVIETKQLRAYSSERECKDAEMLLMVGNGPTNPEMDYLCRYVKFPVKK